jgi:hypothetical protein
VIVALTLIAFALIAVMVWQTWRFDRERDRWRAERERLVNAAIARHAGEVIALNRTTKRDEDRPAPFLVEGIS